MKRAAESGILPPDQAFKVLGNETRLQILRTLGEADGPLSFSDLYQPIELPDSGQFAYHLDKLQGHFVRKTDRGYTLTQAGRRVVMAVLSGAVTEDPEIEPAEIDFACHFCGGAIVVGYDEERVRLYCTACDGLLGDAEGVDETTDRGYIGSMSLPPAGIRHRTVREILQAATTWSHLDLMAWASDVCPRCSAAVTHSLDVCDHHDRNDGLCEQCERRYAIGIRSRCTNCIHQRTSYFGLYLMDAPELLAFVAEHGLNPVADGIEWGWEFEEQLCSVEPFEAEFTLTIEGDALTLTVNDDLSVVEATTESTSEAI